MNHLKKISLLLLMLAATATQAQILISLLFGKTLNTEKIEFGLTGGLNQSYLLDIEDAEGLNNFNLGFYFHIRMMPKSFLSTGVLMKSNVGATGMPTYPVGDEGFDAVFLNGTRTITMNIFYVPLMWQQRLHPRFFIEGGVQTGLRRRVFDSFEAESSIGEVSFQANISNKYSRLDFGLIGGMGYKFKDNIKSMSIGVLYYYGLIDMHRDPEIQSRNSSVYAYMRIPIGMGPKKGEMNSATKAEF